LHASSHSRTGARTDERCAFLRDIA